MPHFDAFISYRRNNGGELAQLMHIALTAKGFAAFLDVRDLTSGPFDTALDEIVRRSKDFILILSPGSLDRCTDPDDWLRREIAQAFRCGLNIIPVATEGFQMPAPDLLPAEISTLITYQCFTYRHEYVEACLSRVMEALKAKPRINVGRMSLWLGSHAAWVATIAAIKLSGRVDYPNERRYMDASLAVDREIRDWSDRVARTFSPPYGPLEAIRPRISELEERIWNLFPRDNIQYIHEPFLEADDMRSIAERIGQCLALRVEFKKYGIGN